MKTASAELGFMSLKEKQPKVITSFFVWSIVMFAVDDVMSCAFHGDKRMVRYLPDPFSLFG